MGSDSGSDEGVLWFLALKFDTHDKFITHIF